MEEPAPICNTAGDVMVTLSKGRPTPDCQGGKAVGKGRSTCNSCVVGVKGKNQQEQKSRNTKFTVSTIFKVCRSRVDCDHSVC